MSKAWKREQLQLDLIANDPPTAHVVLLANGTCIAGVRHGTKTRVIGKFEDFQEALAASQSVVDFAMDPQTAEGTWP